LKRNLSLFLGLFFPWLFALQGCFAPTQPQSLKNFRLPMPTKDEVALVNGRPLTVMDFLIIRSALKNPTDQNVYWAGTAALSLQEDSRSKGNELPLQTALAIVQYALNDLPAVEVISSIREFYIGRSFLHPPSPAEVKKEIDMVMRKTLIQKGAQALSQLY
jgi:hypothetical protein